MSESAVKHLRVLAIDDSPDFLSNLQSFFETMHDFQLIATAASADEGIALVQELHPDLVLMDLQMAGMNGLEATLEIRRSFSEVPVVIITGHEIPGLKQVCHANGAHDCVKKSRLYQDLPNVLAQLLFFRDS
jgi:DNA-binding NarL/FixJ family response regulator